MARTIKRLSPAERSESVVHYALLAVVLTGMIGVTLYARSSTLSIVPLAGLE